MIISAISFSNLGSVSLTVFPSQFKFDGNFVSPSHRLKHRDRYKILYMARQLCCRGMCKNLCAMASQITSITIVCSTVYSGTDQRKHQSSASLAFVRGIHRWTMISPHKGPVTRKMFPFDDVIMRGVCNIHGTYCICGGTRDHKENVSNNLMTSNRIYIPQHKAQNITTDDDNITLFTADTLSAEQDWWILVHGNFKIILEPGH